MKESLFLLESWDKRMSRFSEKFERTALLLLGVYTYWLEIGFLLMGMSTVTDSKRDSSEMIL
jgi:hypothetical protein